MSTALTGDRASTVRQHDLAREWNRRARTLSALFLDPDLDPQCPLVAQLRAAGINATVHADAFELILKVGTHRPDALVLSARTPVGDAVRTVTILRAECGLPVLLAMAERETEAAAPVIAAGARPLVERPYRFDALVSALGEFSPSRAAAGPVRVGGLVLDPDGLDARYNGSRLDLAPKEFSLLWVLGERADKVVPQTVLLAELWPGRAVTTATLSTVVARVRHHLTHAGIADAIHTSRGVGYRLDTAAVD